MEAVGMVFFTLVAIVAVWRCGVWRDRWERAQADAHHQARLAAYYRRGLEEEEARRLADQLKHEREIAQLWKRLKHTGAEADQLRDFLAEAQRAGGPQ